MTEEMTGDDSGENWGRELGERIGGENWGRELQEEMIAGGGNCRR